MDIQIPDLPEQTRSRLLAATNNLPPSAILIDESRRLRAASGIVAAVIGIIFAFTEADGYRWQQSQRAVFFLVTIASLVVGSQCLVYIVGWYKSPFKPCVLINPFYFLRFRFDHVYAIPVWSPENWSVVHLPDSKGTYKATRLFFSSGTGDLEILEIRTIRQANDLIATLKHFNTYVSELALHNDANTLRQLDLLYEWRMREEQFPRAPNGKTNRWQHMLKGVRPSLLPALFGVGIFMLGVDPYNNYRDDELRWQTAMQSSTATAYRLYEVSRPDGKHVSQAQDSIATLYEHAANSYRSLAGSGTSQGTEAVIQILEYAKNTGHYKIYVHFSGDDQIPPDIDDRLRALTGVSKVIPVLPSFSSSMNQARQTSILKRISDSFGRIIPGDILQFTAGDPSPKDVGVRVAYVIGASGMYFPVKEEHLPEIQRDWYTGISFNWDVDIFIPTAESSAFHLSLKSAPAQLFEVAYARTTGEGSEFTPSEAYDAMAESAFDDFGSKFLSQLSIQ